MSQERTPRPLTESPAAPGSFEAFTADLLRQVATPALTDDRASAVHRRLRQSVAAPRLPVTPILVAGAVVVLAALVWLFAPTVRNVLETSKEPAAPAAVIIAPPAASPEPTAAARSVGEPVRPAPPVEHVRASTSPQTVLRAPTAPTEEQLLARALRELRVERNPARAIATVDELLARFSRGALAHEAARVKIEALLAGTDSGPALAELDRWSARLTELPGAAELYLVRGELRASVGRCREALVDLDAAGTALGPADTERALIAALTCQQQLGQSEAMRRTARALLRQFPNSAAASIAKELAR